MFILDKEACPNANDSETLLSSVFCLGLTVFHFDLSPVSKTTEISLSFLQASVSLAILVFPPLFGGVCKQRAGDLVFCVRLVKTKQEANNTHH